MDRKYGSPMVKDGAIGNTWNKFQEEIKEQSLCGACGQYYDEAQQGDDAYHSPELCDANDEVFDYEGRISFTTNQKLTQDQLNQLMDIISLQIIEPVDADQNDEDYSTRNAEVTVKEVE
jgi:hypothetical protein